LTEDLSGTRGLEQATAQAVSAFHMERSSPLCNPITHLGPMVPGERLERPVGIGNHADAGFPPDQDGHVGALFATARRRFGSLQELAGMVQE
jgi:hypothetical protein